MLYMTGFEPWISSMGSAALHLGMSAKSVFSSHQNILRPGWHVQDDDMMRCKNWKMSGTDNLSLSIFASRKIIT